MKHLFALVAVGIGLCTPSCAVFGNLGTNASSAGVVTAVAGGKLTPAEDRATGLYGYVNDFGVWAIPPRYQSASPFNDAGVACVRSANRYGAINPMNQVVVEFNFRDWTTAQAAARSLSKGRLPGVDLWLGQDAGTGLNGYLDCQGRWFIAPQYTGGYEFNNDGFAVVEVSQGRWGVIDRRNEMVIQPNFSTSDEAASALRRLTR